MKFVFNAVVVSTSRREYKGKIYNHLNLEQDGEVFVLECSPEVVEVVQKYREHCLHGRYVKGEYQGRVFTKISVVGAEVLNR